MEIYSGNLTGNYDTDVAKMDGILRPAENFDMLKRELTLNGRRMVMYYIDGFIKSESMQKLMMYLFTVKDIGDGSDHAAADFASRAVPTVEVDVTDSIDQLVLMVMSGCTEGFGKNALVIDLRTYPARETEEPENDKVMRGSRDGFVETLMFNLAMIRRRIRTSASVSTNTLISRRSLNRESASTRIPSNRITRFGWISTTSLERLWAA